MHGTSACSKTCVPHRFLGEYSFGEYETQPSEDARLVALQKIVEDCKVSKVEELLAEQLALATERWRSHEGDRSSIARIVKNERILLPAQTEMVNELREWALEDLDDAYDFEMAAALISSRESLDDDFAGRVYDSFQIYVDTQENFIINDAADADEARSAKDEVESLAIDLSIAPNWDEEEIDDHIGYLQVEGDTDDFDYEGAQEAHDDSIALDSVRDEMEEIDLLFDSLVDTEPV